jgi:hypothetical protein
MRYRIFIITLLIISSTFAQKEKPQNYKRFDEKLLHFGFMLGFNKSDFSVYQNIDAYSKYGLKTLTTTRTPGGQVGIVTTMKLFTPVVRLRFIPTLSFQERVLNYTFVNKIDPKGKDLIYEKRVGSTNLNFPLMLQFRTLRLNNFAAYLLIGAQYTMDLQSQEKASQNYTNPFIKIKKNDYQGQIGAGLEFFAPYFKFGMELKYSQGFNNSFIQDNTEPSNPIDRMYNNTLWISLIFEG